MDWANVTKIDTQDRCSMVRQQKHGQACHLADLEQWAVVSDTLVSELYVMRVFSFYFSQLIAKVRTDKHCISAFR